MYLLLGHFLSNIYQYFPYENSDNNFSFFLDADKVKTSDDLKVQFDITRLTEKERIALFKKEAPEFHGILQDFEAKMAEISETLEPFKKLLDEGRIPASGPVVEFVNLKYKLTLT